MSKPTRYAKAKQPFAALCFCGEKKNVKIELKKANYARAMPKHGGPPPPLEVSFRANISL